MVKNKSKPTLEDIASHSGVSLATVSRVINNSSPVSRDLESRVRKAMKELGFHPKRSKARSRPDIIAFVVSEVVDPAIATAVKGAQEEADRLGVCLVVLNVSRSPGSRKYNLKLFKHMPFDGVIIMHGDIEPADIFELSNRQDIPCVLLGREVSSPQVHCINMDREDGLYQATKYLISLNHKDIAYLSGPLEWEVCTIRLRGIQRALTEAGLSLNPDFYRWSFTSLEDGFQVVSSMLNLSSGKRPTAIITFNDVMAIGALHAIQAFGLTVPDDISVIGFDDIYLSLHTNPPLTTISHPKYQMGQLAIQKIYNNLNGYETETGGFTFLECPLVVRKSTALCKR